MNLDEVLEMVPVFSSDNSAISIMEQYNSQHILECVCVCLFEEHFLTGRGSSISESATAQALLRNRSEFILRRFCAAVKLYFTIERRARGRSRGAEGRYARPECM